MDQRRLHWATERRSTVTHRGFEPGRDVRLRLGYAAQSLGNTKQLAVATAAFEDGFRLAGDHFVFVGLHGENRLFNTWGRDQLLSSARVAMARNLDPDRQLLLGGDWGLRLSVTIPRWRSPVACHSRAAPLCTLGAFEVVNVGVGLRLASSRSAEGRMIDVDVTYPLDGTRRDVHWLVRMREEF